MNLGLGRAGDVPIAVWQWLEAHRGKLIAFTLPLVLLIHLAFATLTLRRSNLDQFPSDQFAEIYLANAARGDVFPQRTDGVRHPLWSWTVSHLCPSKDMDILFATGKWINTVICTVFLAALGLAVARWLDPLATVNLLLLSSLGILLVRGAYFQPEPIFFILFFVAAWLAWRILLGAGWAHFLAFGIVAALAFLAKPSLIPFLAVFAGAFALRLVLAIFKPDAKWPAGKNCLRLAGACVLSGLLLVPLGRYSLKAYGKPFFSYTKFWMWMDDFKPEAYAFAVQHPGRAQLEKLSPDEIPGPAWYFRRHTVRDALARLTQGAGDVTARFFFPETRLNWRAFFWRKASGHWRQPLVHRGVYLLALVALCGVLAWPARREVLARLCESGPLACAALAVGTVGIYIMLYGWYVPIGKGDRFMGCLWIPAIFIACWAAFSLRRLAGGPWTKTVYLAVHALVLVSLLVQVACIVWLFSEGRFLETQN